MAGLAQIGVGWVLEAAVGADIDALLACTYILQVGGCQTFGQPLVEGQPIQVVALVLLKSDAPFQGQ